LMTISIRFIDIRISDGNTMIFSKNIYAVMSDEYLYQRIISIVQVLGSRIVHGNTDHHVKRERTTER